MVPRIIDSSLELSGSGAFSFPPYLYKYHLLEKGATIMNKIRISDVTMKQFSQTSDLSFREKIEM